MYFDSLSELLAMDGHGPYVWSAYLITFAALIILVWWPLTKKSRFLARQARRQQLQKTPVCTELGSEEPVPDSANSKVNS